MNLNGNKTYLVALLMVAYGLIGWGLGDMDVSAAGQFILNGLAAAGLRHGIASK